MIDFHDVERRVVVGTRYLTVVAVLGSLGGALLMLILGLINIVDAFRFSLPMAGMEPLEAGEEPSSVSESLAVISVIEGLDRFLIAIVLLYFSYGVYSLFIRPGRAESELSLPEWLRVKQIGQLKQVVAEVIIVILFVLFLRVVLRVFQDPNVAMSWEQVATMLLLPFSTFLLGLSLRLVQLHPKPKRPTRDEEAATPPARTDDDADDDEAETG